jgi:hypothetical protein
LASFGFGSPGSDFSDEVLDRFYVIPGLIAMAVGGTITSVFLLSWLL